MVFKIISVGSIPATLVILLFKFLTRRIKTHKHTRKVFGTKSKVNSSKFRRLYIHPGDFTKSDTFHKNTLNSSYQRNYCLLSNMSNTLNIYTILNKSCFALPFLRGKWSHLVFTEVTPSQRLFSSAMLLPFFTLYTRLFSQKLPVYSIKTVRTNSLIRSNHLCNPNVSIKTNVFSSWCLLTIIRGAAKLFFTKKVFGTYIVAKDSFFTNNVYFPSVTNIKTFNTLVAFKTIKNLKCFNPTIRSGWNIQMSSQLHSKFPLDFGYTYKNNLHFLPRSKQLFSYNKSLKGVAFLETLVKYVGSQKIQFLKNLVSKKKNAYLVFKFCKRWNIQKRYALNSLVKSSRVITKFSLKKKTFRLLLNKVYYYRQLRAVYSCDSFKTSQSSLFRTKYSFKKIRLYGALKESPATTNPNSYCNSHLYYNSRSIFSKKFCLFTDPLVSPLIYKLGYFFNYTTLFKHLEGFFSNLSPCSINFKKKVVKQIYSARLNYVFRENITPWVYNTLIKFMEFYSGRKIYVDFYSFMNQAIDPHYIVLYKSWMPRFSYYERRLGHRFFLEEALHILHMGFNYQDSKLISSWLKSIIQRISFWKTRFIFRFIKYLFNNYFQYIFKELGVKGFKIKLKGKISVAGNSRKRCILYRVGKTSHSTHQLKVVHTMDKIVTFTGVMGFQIWIFY